MAITAFKTWSTGEVLTASDLNSSFSQIIDGDQSIGFPRTSSADFDGQDLILDADGDSTLDANTDDIATFTLRGQELVRLDGATDGATVNGFTLYCSATGNDVQILAQGSDTDIDIDIVPKGSGSVLLDGTAVGTAISRDTGTGTTNVPLVSDILGNETIWVPASAMTPHTTSGCSALTQIQVTGSTVRSEILGLAFDGSSIEHAFFQFPMPKSWDGGNITFKAYYVVRASVTSTVKWDLFPGSIANDEAFEQILSSNASITDAYTGTADDLAITDESGTVTPVGTIGDDNLIHFTIRRDGSSDSTTQDAYLCGVRVLYTVNALNDS